MKFFMNLALLMFVAVNASGARFEKIADNEVLLNLRNETGLETLPLQMTLVSWNVEKAKQKEKWRKDFLSLSDRSDLFLLQEGMTLSPLPTHLK